MAEAPKQITPKIGYFEYEHYTEVWAHNLVPPRGSRYRVIRDEWEVPENGKPARYIFEWEMAERVETRG